jgi:hypothetical protein
MTASAYETAQTALSLAKSANSLAEFATHNVDAYANGVIVLKNCAVNFCNSPTMNVIVTPNGNKVDIRFSANISALTRLGVS